MTGPGSSPSTDPREDVPERCPQCGYPLEGMVAPLPAGWAGWVGCGPCEVSYRLTRTYATEAAARSALREARS